MLQIAQKITQFYYNASLLGIWKVLLKINRNTQKFYTKVDYGILGICKNIHSRAQGLHL